MSFKSFGSLCSSECESSYGASAGLLFVTGSGAAGDLICCACCCRCVGVESPSHAIRADADPLARSATSVVITLADKYTYDCPVNILIYPSGRSAASKVTHSTAISLPPPLSVFSKCLFQLCGGFFFCRILFCCALIS